MTFVSLTKADVAEQSSSLQSSQPLAETSKLQNHLKHT